jgi:TetR/AcrR family transcriptional regulator
MMNMAQERRALERMARRRWIQEVARGVFAQNGFAGSSIEQIAKAAQLSVGSIYLHFRSKDDLCVSLIEEAMSRFDVQMSELREHASVPLRLHGALELLIEWARRNEDARVLRLLAEPRIRTQLSDEVRLVVARGTSRIKEHLTGCVSDGVASGLYRSVEASEVAELLWSMLLGCLDSHGIQASLGEEPTPLATRAWKGFALIEQALLATTRAAA